MDSTQVISLIESGQAQPGWSLHYTKPITNLRVNFKYFFYLFIFAGLTAAFYLELLTTGDLSLVPTDDRYYGLLTAIFALYFLSKTLQSIYTFFHKNFAVATDKALITKWNGRVTEYPYKDIAELRLTYIAGRNKPIPLFGYQYFSFKDKRSGHQIEIGQRQYFHNQQELFTNLSSKIHS